RIEQSDHSLMPLVFEVQVLHRSHHIQIWFAFRLTAFETVMRGTRFRPGPYAGEKERGQKGIFDKTAVDGWAGNRFVWQSLSHSRRLGRGHEEMQANRSETE